MFGSFEAIGGTNTGKHLKSGLENASDKPLALFDFDQFAKVPRELFSEVEIILDVLRVDVFVVEDILQDENVKNARIAPNLLVLVGSMLEFNLGVPSCAQELSHKHIVNGDFIRAAISCFTDKFAPTRFQKE